MDSTNLKHHITALFGWWFGTFFRIVEHFSIFPLVWNSFPYFSEGRAQPPTSSGSWKSHEKPSFPYGFPMVIPWFSYGFPMVILRFSYGYPKVFLWLSSGFPLVFLWISYGYPKVFLWFSSGLNAYLPQTWLSKNPFCPGCGKSPRTRLSRSSSTVRSSGNWRKPWSMASMLGYVGLFNIQS